MYMYSSDSNFNSGSPWFLDYKNSLDYIDLYIFDSTFILNLHSI